jgi:hypothetical protein
MLHNDACRQAVPDAHVDTGDLTIQNKRRQEIGNDESHKSKNRKTITTTQTTKREQSFSEAAC